jgi:hypothetical protein
MPLTGEVCVSPYLSAIGYAAVLPHEYAHAAGVIREREADFYAFVGASRSRCALVRYAAFVEMRNRLSHAALAAGISDAGNRVRAVVSDGVQHEIDVLAGLYQERAFAPGGKIEVKEDAATGTAEVAAVTSGEAPGRAPVAVYQAVSASAGLPPDYDSCVPLCALWVLEH